MVTGPSFSSSVSLLGTSAYPSSVASASSIWAVNSSPHDGSSTGSAGACIVIQVLQAFNIPILNADVLPSSTACSLPGYDINNMEALAALKLGLAVFLKDGQIWEVLVNSFGMAEFVQVYPSPRRVTLDVRSCIPTSNLEDEARVVIVSGYDAPPVRHVKPPYTVIPRGKAAGEFTPTQAVALECFTTSKTLVYGSSITGQTCQGKIFDTVAIVSYKDPVLNASYKDQQHSPLYTPSAFESLLCYIIDFDTGHTKNTVSYQSSATTSLTYGISFGGLQSTNLNQCAVMQSSSTYASFGYERHVVDQVSVLDRYGDYWPVILGIQAVEVLGHTIQSVLDYRGPASSYGGGYVKMYVDERIVLSSVPVGKNWHWTYENGQLVVYLYSPKYSGADGDYIWEVVNASPAKLYPYRAAGEWSYDSTKYPMSTGEVTWTGRAWPQLGAGLGQLVYKAAFSVLLDRPSMIINDPEGNALDYAALLEVKYYPVVLEDKPPPVAYVIDGVLGYVDHTLDIFDNDPTTVQPDPVSLVGSNAWLQTQKAGHTVEVSLPFLATESECGAVAQMLYNMYNNFGYKETTYSLVCGPDDEPQLGAVVEGFPSDLRINEISYNFQDSSSYSINVSLGPIFLGTGSWNSSTWQRRTETVSREGIIVWAAGDGVSYRVRVRGIGEFFALNATDSGNVMPGEKVSVRIYNNPIEA